MKDSERIRDVPRRVISLVFASTLLTAGGLAAAEDYAKELTVDVENIVQCLKGELSRELRERVLPYNLLKVDIEGLLNLE